MKHEVNIYINFRYERYDSILLTYYSYAGFCFARGEHVACLRLGLRLSLRLRLGL